MTIHTVCLIIGYNFNYCLLPSVRHIFECVDILFIHDKYLIMGHIDLIKFILLYVCFEIKRSSSSSSSSYAKYYEMEPCDLH